MLTEAEAQPNNKQQIKHCSVLVLVVTITPYLIQPPELYMDSSFTTCTTHTNI